MGTDIGIAGAAASSRSVVSETLPRTSDAKWDARRVRHLASNLGLALLFFLALKPGTAQYGSGLANWIWIVGAGLMGLLSLVRVPPTTSMITIRSITSTAAMMITPTMIRPGAQSTGWLLDCALMVELFGVVFSQVSRLYLGRSFGLLPANRGIVSAGPFRLVRHPIYVGWFILTAGYAMAYPSLRNVFVIMLTLPFMMWRITLEEELLTQDAEYREYCQKTRYRLIPGLL